MDQRRGITTAQIAMVAVFAALALVFNFAGDFIPIPDMPQGGSIEIEMIMLFFASYILGSKLGALTGIIYWILAFMTNQASYFLNVPQYLLDYIIPIMVCGASSIFMFKKISNLTLRIEVAIFISMLIKTLCNVLSGVFYYFPEGEVAGSIGSWTYSLGYNTPYNLVTMIICMILVPIVISRIAPRLRSH